VKKVDTKIIAHRGSANKTPENTKAAFVQAKEDGANGVEFDVHLTKDEEAVVIHDPQIDRVSNGKGFIKDYTLKELKQFDFGSYFGKNFKGEKILTLSEALQITKDFSLINIEIKKGYNINQGIEKKVIEEVKKYDLEEKIIISSYNHESLVITKNINSNLKIAPLFFAKPYQVVQYLKNLNTQYIHPYYLMVNQELVDELHKNDIKLNVYTVDHLKDIKLMAYYGVDGIITNHTENALKLLK